MHLNHKLLERFENFVSPEPMSGCWLWIGSGPYGYGQFSAVKGQMQVRAHRFSWSAYRGDIPKGMHVLHKCDVRCCVNPDHLFLGSHQDNMADKVSKGRQQRGENQRQAKLTRQQVEAIRERYSRGNGKALAGEFGVSRQTISKVTLGQSWRAA